MIYTFSIRLIDSTHMHRPSSSVVGLLMPFLHPHCLCVCQQDEGGLKLVLALHDYYYRKLGTVVGNYSVGLFLIGALI